MPICNPSDLLATLPRRARLLGFDVGAKTIGIAVSDPDLTLATPVETIRRTTFARDAARIAELVAYWKVGGFVVGLALNMNDSEGPSAQRCRDFARNLLARIDLPLIFRDERLSTFAAEEALADSGSRRTRGKLDVDRVAAAVILQDALDDLRRR